MNQPESSSSDSLRDALSHLPDSIKFETVEVGVIGDTEPVPMYTAIVINEALLEQLELDGVDTTDIAVGSYILDGAVMTHEEINQDEVLYFA